MDTVPNRDYIYLAQGGPIEKLNVSKRSFNALKRSDIQTVEDNTQLVESGSLRSIRGLGTKCLLENKEKLALVKIHNSLEVEANPESSLDRNLIGLASKDSIATLNLTLRSFNALARADIRTVGAVVELIESCRLQTFRKGEWPIPAFDNTRNNTLNRQNPVVVVLLGWISQELEAIRSDLVRQARERRQSEMEAKLTKEAERISEILNQDFAEQEMELELARSVSKRRSGRSVKDILDDKGELLPGDGDEQTTMETYGNKSDGNGQSSYSEKDLQDPDKLHHARTQRVPESVRPRGANDLGKRFFPLSLSVSPLIRIDRDTMETRKTIFINLDHPQIRPSSDFQCI